LLTDFHPIKGPVSGGTSLTLVGFHLDAGVDAALMISDAADETLSVGCVFSDHRQSNDSVCVTSSASRPFNGSVIQFTIDGVVVPHTVPPHGFSMLFDPTIHSVVPQETIVRWDVRIFGSFCNVLVMTLCLGLILGKSTVSYRNTVRLIT